MEILLSAELVRVVTLASDTDFLPYLSLGATSVSATDDFLVDLNTALLFMEIDSSAKLMLFAAPNIVRGLSLKTDPDGRALFPTLSLSGGVVQGIEILPTDALTDDAILVDARQLAIQDAGIQELETKTQGDILYGANPNMAAAGGSPPGPVHSPLVSLWQTNTVALVIRRAIAYSKLRPTAAVVLADPGW